MSQQPKTMPFTCYFCSKLVENDTEISHYSTCGLVLESCPNRCGLYVPRTMKSAHMKECKNTKSSVARSRESYHELNGISGNNTNSLDRTKKSSRNSNVPLVSSQYLDQMMKKQQQHLDQVLRYLSQNVEVLKSKQQELIHVQNTNQLQTKMHIEKLHMYNQILTEWKKGFEIQFKNLKKDIYHLQMNQLSKASVASQSNLLQLESNLSSLNQEFQNYQMENHKSLEHFQKQFTEFGDRFVEENAVVAALWNDHKSSIDKLVNKIEDVSKTQSDFKNKQVALNFDLKSVIQTSGESCDKVEIQQRLLAEMQKELSQLKTDYKNLEESSTNELIKQKFTGNFVWKIDNFKVKMENAKENDTFLKSPIFYTHDFGYKVRLHLYLNGIKKWKGRHAIMCLHVLKGQYDLLLKWPCYIEGTVILRDLYNHSKPTDYSKYILAKRHSGDEEEEEPQELSTQYIFIPHTTLTKQNFLREDTLFIEIQIISTDKNKDETEL